MSRDSNESRFAFSEWAAREGFSYPDRALPMLERCESPPEAYFVRRFFEHPATLYAGGEGAWCRGVAMRVQVLCRPYRIDVVAERKHIRLAIEIDGYEWHQSTRAQVTADYYRARRLICAGYTLMRFTAAEAMSKPTDCWRDVFAAIKAHERVAKSA